MPAAIAQLNAVSKLYGSFAAVRNVSATFESGKCYVVVGENGAGKSTLLRILAGLAKPSVGTVSIHGLPPLQSRGAIGLMSHASMLYEELSALENLHYYAQLYPQPLPTSPETALASVGLPANLPRPVAYYSQGMRQRVALARVLMSEPSLLLLDEPFSNMDRASTEQMVALLIGLKSSTRAIILTTHQPERAASLGDVFLEMKDGTFVSSPPTAGAMATGAALTSSFPMDGL